MEPVEKLRRVKSAIAYGDATTSFMDIINSERKAFSGLKVAYATNTKSTDIHQIPIQQLTEHCPLITSKINSSGVLFYSDSVFEKMQWGETRIPIDYSVSFDKNICENVRLLSKNKTLREPENFRSLLQLVKGRGEDSLNFDYIAYLAEEHEHFQKTGNERPLETLRALKQLDYIDPACLFRHPLNAVYTADSATIDRAVQDLVTSVIHTGALSELLIQRKATYAMMMRAALLSWRTDLDMIDKLRLLGEFSLEVLGKLAKTELYLSWKLFRGVNSAPAFFGPLAQPSKNSRKHILGMSWDLATLRISEQLSIVRPATHAEKSEFFLPFIASFDQRFRLLVQTCPIKAIITCPALKIVNTVFQDELPFQLELEKARLEIGTLADQSRRVNAELNTRRLEQAISTLEEQLHLICN